MTRLTIELTEDLRTKAAARAAQSGHASIEEYLQDLLRIDAAVPTRLKPQSRTDLETMLDKGMNSPASEITPADWERKQLARLREKAGHQEPGQQNPQSKAG